MEPETKMTLFKVGIVWTGVVVGKTHLGWAELAAFSAFVYSCLLIVGWFWDRFGYPLCLHMGWIKPRRRKDRDEVSD